MDDLEAMLEELQGQAQQGPGPTLPPEGGGENGAPTQAQPPAVDDELRREMAELKAQFEAEAKRRSDSQAAYQEERQARLMAERFLQAQQEHAAREAAYLQHQRSVEMPQVDPEEWISDPKKLQEYLMHAGGALLQQIRSEFAPYTGDLAAVRGMVEAQSSLTERQAKKEAEANIKEQLGLDDFDELWPEVKDTLEKQGPAGRQLLHNPDALRTVYLALRGQKGKPFTAPARSEPVEGAPARPSGKPRASEGMDRRRAAMVRDLQHTLGVDFTPNDDDLSRVGLR